MFDCNTDIYTHLLCLLCAIKPSKVKITLLDEKDDVTNDIKRAQSNVTPSELLHNIICFLTNGYIGDVF